MPKEPDEITRETDSRFNLFLRSFQVLIMQRRGVYWWSIAEAFQCNLRCQGGLGLPPPFHLQRPTVTTYQSLKLKGLTQWHAIQIRVDHAWSTASREYCVTWIKTSSTPFVVQSRMYPRFSLLWCILRTLLACLRTKHLVLSTHSLSRISTTNHLVYWDPQGPTLLHLYSHCIPISNFQW